MKPFVQLLALIGALFVLRGLPVRVQTTERTVWNGVYTKEQAIRGQQAYRKACTYCHHDDLLGGEDLQVIPPALVGITFSERWNNRSVAELFRTIAETMPWRRPSLDAQSYADILTYLLQENGMPAGATELPAAIAPLENILITDKPKP